MVGKALSSSLLMLATLSVMTGGMWQDVTPVYPGSRRVDQLDRYHGVEVADPYRWLEIDSTQSVEVAAWIRNQNALTKKVLASHPDRHLIKQRLKDLWNYERFSAPQNTGNGYAYFHNNGLQNQPILYLIETLKSEPRVLLDPNRWSIDGTIALTGTIFSCDGRYLAYAISESGSDWQTWYVLDVNSGTKLADELKWVKFAYLAWTPDGTGFYYNRYDEPKPSSLSREANLNHRICYHRLGTKQSQDKVIYSAPEHPDWKVASPLTPDGRFLLLVVREADDDRHRILYRDLTKPDAKFVELISQFAHQFHFIGNDGNAFYFMTNHSAPRRRLVAIDILNPDVSNWKEIIPEGKETLIDVGLVGERFLATTLQNVNTRVRVYTIQGDYVRDVTLPAIGTASGFSGRREDVSATYTFSSFCTPPTVYRYDVVTGISIPLREPKVRFNPIDYEIKQVVFTSKDGTKVPMFISHRRGLLLDGTNPTLLYGYGGFGFALKPWFSVSAMVWMEAGGVFAVPSLRGGGEFGMAWHQAGTRINKQNVFDDFIAAAEWLIRQKYTQRDKLAIEGGSNGGLLVSAVLTQRPDLFGACLPEVPLTDMLRFTNFTNGQDAVTEYGSPEKPVEFLALRAYSPYHRVQKGTSYPPTLITTGDSDDRVAPLHSFKFAAALQNAQTGNAPILLRVEERAGHGGNKPMAKRIEEVTDQFVFLAQSLKMKWR